MDPTLEIETVARAMCMRDNIDPDEIDYSGIKVPEPYWKRYREAARREIIRGKIEKRVRCGIVDDGTGC